MENDYIICPQCGAIVDYTHFSCPNCRITTQEIRDNYVKHKPMQAHKPECLWYGWAWYIIIMFISLFFKEWYIGWIVATIIFFSWRKEKINEVS